MKFNEDLASIHAYLCADGYVIKNPVSQVHKYYYIGLRNMEIVLLKDFQGKFMRFFGVKPIIAKDGRAKIQNKAIYETLTKDNIYYSANWSFPKLTKRLYSFWLRSYFDCDGWVSVIKAKDRKIGLDSINHHGILQIQSVLYKKFDISSTVKERKNRHIWSLAICGRDDLIKFAKSIGFLHPKKKVKLTEALNSYMDYSWKVPVDKESLIKFIKTKGKFSKKRGQVRFYSIILRNLSDFKRALAKFKVHSRICKSINGNGNSFYTLSIRINELNKFEGIIWGLTTT
jgi:hypothetical protein